MKLYSNEAEAYLLGYILFDGGIGEESDELLTAVKAQDFYDEKHQIIYLAMQALYRIGQNIDFVTLVNYLEEKNKVDAAGGVSYISQLTNNVYIKANFRNYQNIIKNLSKLRTLSKYGDYINKQALSGKTAEEVQSDAEQCLSKITTQAADGELQPIAESVNKEYERITKAAKGEYEPFGVRTGFSEFDRCLWGLRQGNLIILAGRPGSGKTAFALNVILNVATHNKTCAFFSLEMGSDEIARRLFSIGGGIDSGTILSGKGFSQYSNIIESVKNLLNKNTIHIDDTTNQTPQQIMSKAKRLQRKQGLDLIVIDYLQKIRPPRSLNNPVTEIGEVARAVKDIARQLKVPVLCLCQPNRQSERKDGKAHEPLMSDLRGSGEIEQEADVVAFLRTEDPREADVKTVYLQLAKNRNGKMSNFEFEFTGNILTFREKRSSSGVTAKPKISEFIPVQEELPF